MKKKMMLLISMIQIMALSACGNATNVTPMETDIVQTQQSENLEENVTSDVQDMVDSDTHIRATILGMV